MPIIQHLGTAYASGSSATGGNSAAYVSGNGVTYKVHWWTSTGSFVVAGGNLDCDIFVLGGGGSGGNGGELAI